MLFLARVLFDFFSMKTGSHVVQAALSSYTVEDDFECPLAEQQALSFQL